MNISAPFIERPVATSLLAFALLLAGALGFLRLPVSPLPQMDFPTIQVTTRLPGGNPDTIAALVTASLERQFGQIPSLASMSSQSSFGLSQITLQFALDRDIDAAAQDVQQAINSAASNSTAQSSLSADLRQGESGRHAGHGPHAALADRDLARSLRSRRHGDRAAHVAGGGRRPRLGGGRRAAGCARESRSRAARGQ